MRLTGWYTLQKMKKCLMEILMESFIFCAAIQCRRLQKVLRICFFKERIIKSEGRKNSDEDWVLMESAECWEFLHCYIILQNEQRHSLSFVLFSFGNIQIFKVCWNDHLDNYFSLIHVCRITTNLLLLTFSHAKFYKLVLKY